MTDEEINKAISDWCGWTKANQWGPIYLSAEGWSVNCPDCCNDLNAMRKAERMLPPNLWTAMENNLYPADDGHPLHFSARERAVAFLKTIGKWKD